MSSEKKVLGKIARATFGYGGYQDVMFGLSVTLEGEGCGTGDFSGWWALDIDCGENTKWTEADRDAKYAEAVRLLNQTLLDAKKRHVAELVGTPVEITFEDRVLKSWRVLTEVL
jgi:hypothetical protein